MASKTADPAPGKLEVVVSSGKDGWALPAGGPAAQDRVKAANASEKVMIWAKKACPFCLEVRRTFDNLGVPIALYNVDEQAEGGQVWDALKSMTSQKTVPYVYINNEFIGGCDATKALQAKGELEPKLQAAGLSVRASRNRNLADLGVLEGKGRLPGSLFSFPEAVDERVARFNGFYAFVVCLLVAIYHYKSQAHYVMLALAIDYALKFVAGSNASPIGALSVLSAAVLDAFGGRPKWIAGPPKQFANFCGLMFASLSALFYLLERYEWKLTWPGLAFTCALGVAVFLEGFIGFCLGCLFFSLGIRFGLVPSNIYTVYTSTLPETMHTWEDANLPKNEPSPESKVFHLLSAAFPTAIDYRYKTSSDDFKRDDTHIIKHVKIQHFLMFMGGVGCACAWKVAAPCANDATETLCAPREVYYAIALTMSFFFTLWLCLYALKCLMYPAKVYKEWMCNLRGNSFVVPFVTIVLFAFLVEEHSNTFAQVLYWIGAPATLFLSLIKVGDWLAVRKELEHVNAAWMIMPVSNFVSAMVGPLIEVKYRDWCQFLFGFAFIMWLALFSITFHKAVVMKPDDDRMRPLLAIWVAAPAVMGCAYMVCFRYDVAFGDSGFDDFIFINLHWFSCALFLVLAYGFVRPFQGRMRFDMSYWAAGFPTAALSMVTLFYLGTKPGDLSRGIAIAALALTSATNCVLALLTVTAVLRRKLFIPDYKFGPLSFMRITHEAFRGAIPRLQRAVDAVAGGDTSEDAVAELKEQWRLMSMAHDEHSRHEDLVIFKAYNDIIPGLVAPYNEDHEKHHELLPRIQALVNGAGKASVAGLKDLCDAYYKEMERHLRAEEDNLQGMPRKYVNLEMMKQIIRKCWETTSADNWRDFIPWALNSLPMLHQRVRFIKTFLWAMPERAQQIGIMVALGVDAVQWKRITDELPEIIPRGAVGWERYY